VTLGAYAHQDLPFEKVVEALDPDRVLTVHPLFQVVFNLQNAPMQALELPGLTVSSMSLGVKTTRFDLEVHLWEAGDSFRIFHFQTLLSEIVTDPPQSISDLQILTPGERDCLLFEFNSPAYQSLPQTRLQHPSFLHL
jgi:non-ribosomal peptide synthetase component F